MTSAPEPSEVAAEATEEPQASPVADDSSPVDAMLGIPVMDEGEFNDFLVEVIAEGERRTAECMLAEGFEYTPETPKYNGPSASDNTDEREYAKQNGFGIVAALEAATYGDATVLSPNAEFIASLSEGERSSDWAAVRDRDRSRGARWRELGFGD